MFRTRKSALLIGVLFASAVLIVFVVRFGANALREREVRVEVEARDGAVLDGMFAATGHPLVVLSNVTSTNLTRRSNAFNFLFNNSTNVGKVHIRAYMDGEFQGEASSSEGVCGWFKPVMGHTKVYVGSID